MELAAKLNRSRPSVSMLGVILLGGLALFILAGRLVTSSVHADERKPARTKVVVKPVDPTEAGPAHPAREQWLDRVAEFFAIGRSASS